jgi:hypothetical protein
MGVLWLVGALMLAAACGALFVAPRGFWVCAALAAVVSKGLVLTAWSDARVGTLPNLLLAAAAVYGAFACGPFGLRVE